jgi:hypothetical protein
LRVTHFLACLNNSSGGSSLGLPLLFVRNLLFLVPDPGVAYFVKKNDGYSGISHVAHMGIFFFDYARGKVLVDFVDIIYRIVQNISVHAVLVLL